MSGNSNQAKQQQASAAKEFSTLKRKAQEHCKALGDPDLAKLGKVLTGSKKSTVVEKMNKFARLNEDQRIEYLKENPSLALLAVALPSPPERETAEGKEKYNKKEAEFYSWLELAKRRANENQIDEAERAFEELEKTLSEASNVGETMTEDNKQSVEGVVKQFAQALQAADTSSLIVFLCMMREFTKVRVYYEEQLAKDGQGYLAIKEFVDKKAKNITGFDFNYMIEMHGVFELLAEYPRFIWCGSSRDILNKYSKKLKQVLSQEKGTKSDERHYWTTFPDAKYLRGLKVMGDLPKELDVDKVAKHLDYLRVDLQWLNGVNKKLNTIKKTAEKIDKGEKEPADKPAVGVKEASGWDSKEIQDEFDKGWASVKIDSSRIQVSYGDGTSQAGNQYEYKAEEKKKSEKEQVPFPSISFPKGQVPFSNDDANDEAIHEITEMVKDD